MTKRQIPSLNLHHVLPDGLYGPTPTRFFALQTTTIS